jgi:hypothetical protein
MVEPDADDNDRRQLNFDELGAERPDADDFDRILAEHEQRVRVLETALERYIDLMGVRLEFRDATAEVHASLNVPMEELRRLIRVAALDLADALTDLEQRFELGYDPEPGDPLPPAYLAFLWLRSLSYSILKRAGFLDRPGHLPDGRFVYRQLPPKWPILEDILARTVEGPGGEPIILPSPLGDLSEKEIVATPEELRALRSCLTLLRVNSSQCVSLPSAPYYDTPSVDPRTTPRVRPRTDSLDTPRDVTREQREAEPTEGHLGLKVNASEMQITREGFGGTVDLKGKQVLWNVFNILLENKYNYCHQESLVRAWRSRRDPYPAIGPIYMAVSNLRKEIVKLNINIDNSPSLGWRLIESPPPAET